MLDGTDMINRLGVWSLQCMVTLNEWQKADSIKKLEWIARRNEGGRGDLIDGEERPGFMKVKDD